MYSRSEAPNSVNVTRASYRVRTLFGPPRYVAGSMSRCPSSSQQQTGHIWVPPFCCKVRKPQQGHRIMRGMPRSSAAYIAIVLCMLRWLATPGWVMINLLVAAIGTTFIESPLSSLIKVHTIPGILQRTYLLSAVCGCLLGYLVYRRWQPSAAKWLWTAGVGLIALRVIFLQCTEHSSVLFPAERDSLWSAFSGTGCSGGVNAVGCRNWLVFTIPALRMVTYSAGAILCSRLRHEGPSMMLDVWFGRFRPLKIERARDRSLGEQDR
jgi:hypothetical protein